MKTIALTKRHRIVLVELIEGRKPSDLAALGELQSSGYVSGTRTLTPEGRAVAQASKAKVDAARAGARAEAEEKAAVARANALRDVK